MYLRPTQLLYILPDIYRSPPYFNTLFQYSIVCTSYNIEESRFLLACPHSGSTYSTRPVCICIFSYQGTMGGSLRLVLDKICSGLISPKSTQSLLSSAINDFFLIVCFRRMTIIKYPVYQVHIYGESAKGFFSAILLSFRATHTTLPILL